MRHHRLAWITAAAVAAVPFAGMPAHASVPARALAPADVTTPKLIKHVITDVDGDGKRDSVDLTYLGSDTFELAVTTAKGKTAKAGFTSVVSESLSPATATWYGASAMDGRKGSELIVNRYNSESGVPQQSVYTWRSGKLVAEKAPARPKGKGWQVDADDTSTQAQGYTFFTKHGHRYVDASWLDRSVKPGSKWKGSITRSIWRHGGWVKLSTRTAKTVKALTRWGQVGIAGPKLLLHQVSADVNGNATADLTTVYQLKAINHFLVKVEAGGKVLTKQYSTDGGSGFIGAAAVDGVAGAELLFEVRWEAPTYSVLTWRNGKLASLPAPVLNSRPASATWRGMGEETHTNFTVTVDGGKHYVVTGWVADDSNTAHYAKSVWQHGKWTEVLPEWVGTVTDEHPFQSGFIVSDLVKP